MSISKTKCNLSYLFERSLVSYAIRVYPVYDTTQSIPITHQIIASIHEMLLYPDALNFDVHFTAQSTILR